MINSSIGPHFLVAVGGLPEGLTVDQFIEVLDPVDAGAPPPEGDFGAGDVFAKPGQRHQEQFDPHGPWAVRLLLSDNDPAGTPHYKLGFVGLFDVAG